MLTHLPQHAITLHQSMTVDMATDGLPAKLINYRYRFGGR